MARQISSAYWQNGTIGFVHHRDCQLFRSRMTGFTNLRQKIFLLLPAGRSQLLSRNRNRGHWLSPQQTGVYHLSHFHHQFENVTDYLHHRPPYLMVDSIKSLDETEILTEREITGEEFFIKGHFPGAPIMPGAMMQEMSTQSAGILIAAKYNPMEQYNTHDPFFNEFALGVLVKVSKARYRHFARPGDTLLAHIKLHERTDNVFDFSSKISIKESIVMRNRFQLMNIRSDVLQGTDSTRG